LVDQVTIPFYPPDSNPFTPGPPLWWPQQPPWNPPVDPGRNYNPDDGGTPPATYPPVDPGPGPVVDPTPGPPPATDPGGGNVAPSYYDNASAWLGGMANPFYRVTRRVRATKLTKFLEGEAKIGLRAVSQWWSQGAGLGGELARLGVGPDVFPWASKIAGGFVGGMIVSAIFPEHSSDTDQFPLPLKQLSDKAFSDRVKQMVSQDQFTRSRRVPSPAVQELANRVPDVILSEAKPTLLQELERLKDFGIGRMFNPSGWTPFRVAPNATVIHATAPGFPDYTPPPASIDQLAQLAKIGPPATSSSSASSPSSSSSSSGRGRLPQGHIRWGRIGIGVGAIVAANAILPRLFGSSGAGYTAPVVGAVDAAKKPVDPTQPSPVGYSSFGFAGGADAPYCQPRARGPRRKCLERAPVAYRSGARKGKPAGTKCVRYAARRS